MFFCRCGYAEEVQLPYLLLDVQCVGDVALSTRDLCNWWSNALPMFDNKIVMIIDSHTYVLGCGYAEEVQFVPIV